MLVVAAGVGGLGFGTIIRADVAGTGVMAVVMLEVAGGGAEVVESEVDSGAVVAPVPCTF